MDEDYPRNISQGFANIPDDIDAAFAVQAPNHRGKEKAYFFKGTHTSFQYSPVFYKAYVSWSFLAHASNSMCLFLSPGDMFYLYEFKHQPSHAECVDMTRSSPSVQFLHYTDLFCDQSWDDFLSEILENTCKTAVRLL